jgi:hydroxyacylglutathione hydrolase
VTEQVIEGVQWIPGRDRFLPDSHMYVIGKPGSGDFSLVDAGLMEMGSYKLEELTRAGFPLGEIKRIIMTHTHIDHIGCLKELLSAIPDAEVWVHREEAAFLERGDDRIVMGNKIFESMIRSQYKLDERLFTVTVHRKLAGGETLTLGGMQFQVLHIPGHTSGSIGLFDNEHRLLISGDTIYADGAIGRFDLFSADTAVLKNSLNMIADLGVDILLPCHNRIVKGGADPMIRNTVRQWLPLLGV